MHKIPVTTVASAYRQRCHRALACQIIRRGILTNNQVGCLVLAALADHHSRHAYNRQEEGKGAGFRGGGRGGS